MDQFTTGIFPAPDEQLPEVEKTISALIDPDDGSEFPAPETLRSRFNIAEGSSFNDYGDLKLLGLGGMGAVFQADDPALKRKVALKILRSNFRNRTASVEKFIREARITAQIDHPNIVSVHRLGVLENIGVYFTMKRVHGETLREILTKLSLGDRDYLEKYHLRRLLEIFISGCNGIAAAHSHGYIHCDLKPGNLMVGRFGEVQVLDWGVAREKIPQGPLQPVMVEAFSAQAPVEGTPVYMAPELLSGEFTYPDEQTDVYGLGAILYTILSQGKLPFDSSLSPEELALKVVNGEITPLSRHIHGRRRHELRAICRKAMARDRLERYNSVEELLGDIQNYLDGFPVSACSPTVFGKFFKFVRRHPLIPAVVTAVLLSYGVYYGFNLVRQIAEDNALKTIIADNSKWGDTNRRLALRRMERLSDPTLSPEEKENIRHNIFNSALNASIEYNLIFDAASRLSPKARDHFLTHGGTRLFGQILRMYWLLKNRKMVQEFLVRCRTDWQVLFHEACRMDWKLADLVKRIQIRLEQNL
ncbi:MAG: serine/threonine protein kinase [Lentisphaeria bacterium]|nr:serine/threonine protein kinase [Lentisphaeria bacterium]